MSERPPSRQGQRPTNTHTHTTPFSPIRDITAEYNNQANIRRGQEDARRRAALNPQQQNHDNERAETTQDHHVTDREEDQTHNGMNEDDDRYSEGGDDDSSSEDGDKEFDNEPGITRTEENAAHPLNIERQEAAQPEQGNGNLDDVTAPPPSPAPAQAGRNYTAADTYYYPATANAGLVGTQQSEVSDM